MSSETAAKILAYIKQLESERAQLLESFWELEECKQKLNDANLKNKSLENENAVLKMLLRDLYTDLRDSERPQSIFNFYSKKESDVQPTETEISEDDLTEIKSELRELIAGRLKNYKRSFECKI